MAGLHGSARHSQPHQASFIQPDEREEQAHTNCEAISQGGGYALHHPFAQMQDRHEHKQHAGDKDGGQRRLPAHSEHFTNSEGNKGVLAHVGRDGERAPAMEGHQVAAKGGN